MTKHTYPTFKGYAARCNNARRIIRQKGENCLANIYTRGFDDCFENYDGKAVIFYLVDAALSGDDLLRQGIENMGKSVWPGWYKIYREGLPKPETTLPLFGPQPA